MVTSATSYCVYDLSGVSIHSTYMVFVNITHSDHFGSMKAGFHLQKTSELDVDIVQ